MDTTWAEIVAIYSWSVLPDSGNYMLYLVERLQHHFIE